MRHRVVKDPLKPVVPLCYNHGELYRVARKVLSADTWTKRYTFHDQITKGVSPTYFARRHTCWEQKHGKKILLNAYIDKVFTQLVCKLINQKIIEQRWPGAKKTRKTVWEVRLTELGKEQQELEKQTGAVRKKIIHGPRIKMNMQRARLLRSKYQPGTRNGPGSLKALTQEFQLSITQTYLIATNKCWVEPTSQPSPEKLKITS